MALHGLVKDSAGGYYLRKALKTPKARAARISTTTFTHTKTVFNWSTADVKFYEPAMHNFLNGKMVNGKPAPLWSYLEAKGQMAVVGAKAKAGYKTGRLRASIHMRHLGNPTGQYLWIGSKVDYALLHHSGSRPHTITANKPGGSLVFMKGSRVIRTPMVSHPGTRPNRYLSSQLRHFRG